MGAFLAFKENPRNPLGHSPDVCSSANTLSHNLLYEAICVCEQTNFLVFNYEKMPPFYFYIVRLALMTFYRFRMAVLTQRPLELTHQKYVYLILLFFLDEIAKKRMRHLVR